jgi:hypothetical protein
MTFLEDFSYLETFEKFCKENREYCPAEEKDKGDDHTPICHWCRVSWNHAMSRYRDEILKRLK